MTIPTLQQTRTPPTALETYLIVEHRSHVAKLHFLRQRALRRARIGMQAPCFLLSVSLSLACALAIYGVAIGNPFHIVVLAYLAYFAAGATLTRAIPRVRAWAEARRAWEEIDRR